MGKPGQMVLRSKTRSHSHFFRSDKAKVPAERADKKHSKPRAHPSISVKEIIGQLGAQMDPANYLHSSGDRYDLVRVKTVGVLGDKQHGLFAREEGIKPGTVLGRYMGRKFTKKAFEQHLSDNEDATPHYAMAVDTDVVCSEQEGNFTRFANCSTSQPNSAFVRLPDKSVGLKAIRPIEPEQQVLVDYNDPYDPPASQRQLFLNPEDGPQSTIDLFCELGRHYRLQKSPADYLSLGVRRNAPLYTTELVRHIMDNHRLLHLHEPLEVDLLCLKATKEGMVKLAGKHEDEDPFTPLMLACYLGQVENVRYLIENGAGVNRQQNISGKCPLFFALDGYCDTGESKDNFLAIILELLRGRALTTVHDPEYRTFLHKASLVLQPDHLSSVLSQLAEMGIAIKELFDYVDKYDRDVVMSCLEKRCVDNVVTLLKFYPAYFGDHFLPLAKGRKKDYFRKALNDTLESYTPEEAHSFFDCLTGAHIADLDLTPLDNLRAKADSFLSEQEGAGILHRT